MSHVSGSIIINRPIEQVFDFVADERNELTYNDEIVSSTCVTDGPIGIGTRFRALMRSRGREMPMEIIYTEFDRPRHIGSHVEMKPMSIDGELNFTRAGNSTRMAWDWDLRPRGMMRLLDPFIGRMGEKRERKMAEGLRHRLEAYA